MLNCCPHTTRGAGASGFACERLPAHIFAAKLTVFRIWNGIWWVVILIIYFPESQTRAKGQAARAILKRIDYLGGTLSITGLTIL